MKQIAKDYIHKGCSDFGYAFNCWLVDLNANGVEFKVTEYYNNSMSAYVFNGEFYVCRITDVPVAGYCVGTINKFKDDDELRTYLLKYKDYRNVADIDAIVLDMLSYK